MNGRAPPLCKGEVGPSALELPEVRDKVVKFCRERWHRFGQPGWLDLNDFIQEVYLRLLEAEEKEDGSPLDVENPGWQGFLRRRIKWTLDDLGRKDRKRSERERPLQSLPGRNGGEGGSNGRREDGDDPLEYYDASDEDCFPVPERVLERSERLRELNDLSDLASLSPREREVITLICETYTPIEIAQKLGVKPDTVYAYLSEAKKKLRETRGCSKDTSTIRPNTDYSG